MLEWNGCADTKQTCFFFFVNRHTQKIHLKTGDRFIITLSQGFSMTKYYKLLKAFNLIGRQQSADETLHETHPRCKHGACRLSRHYTLPRPL